MASFETRGNSVRAIIRLPGGKKTSRTFDTQAAAEKWAADMERKKTLGTARAGSTPTNRDLFEAYMSVAEKLDSGKANGHRLMLWMNDPLADLTVAETITHDIDEWIARRLKQTHHKTNTPITPATVNRELNLMSAAFTYAVKTRKWISENPCYGANRPAKTKGRNRPLLTAEELEAFCIASGYSSDPGLKTVSARVGATFLLALETGMRSGEILRLRPEDYFKSQRKVHVSATERGGRKGARSGRASTDPSRNVPLTARAMELLDQLLQTMPEDQKPNPKAGFAYPPYIVGLDDSQRDANFRKARKRAGIAELRYHDTKHEAATKLAKFLDVLALSHAIGTKDIRLLRDTYYNNDAERSACRPAVGSSPVYRKQWPVPRRVGQLGSRGIEGRIGQA